MNRRERSRNLLAFIPERVKQSQNFGQGGFLPQENLQGIFRGSPANQAIHIQFYATAARV